MQFTADIRKYSNDIRILRAGVTVKEAVESNLGVEYFLLCPWRSMMNLIYLSLLIYCIKFFIEVT
jgi:hypothetical protein